MSVNRCYSEKKPGFDVEARSLFSSLHDLLEIKNLTHVRYLYRYDAEGLAPETYEKAKGIVFSEPMADVCYDEDFPRPEGAHTILAVEPLPGQFDQRADSCAQCIQLLTGGERPTVAAAKIYVLEGHGEAELPTTFSEQLEKENMELNTFSLLTVDAIPEDAACVMIYAPTTDISQEEKDISAHFKIWI